MQKQVAIGKVKLSNLEIFEYLRIFKSVYKINLQKAFSNDK